MRGHDVAYIAQSAAQSFNPRIRLNDQVIEPALIRRQLSRQAALERARALYRSLGLPDPDHIGSRYPHQVSGGQLQRFMIRSEEHTSELQSLMRISYAVFCLKKKKQ